MSEKLLKLTNTLQRCIKSQSNKGRKESQKTRKLQIDTLEERNLLSISPGTPTDIQINQPDPAATIPGFLSYQTQALAGGNQSSAVNDWGDFVTTWAQDEPAWRRDENGALMIDNNGNYIPYIDPITQTPVMESNIYARYFTDEVQRVTIPMELLAPDNGASKSRISMLYGGNEVQKLTFATANAPEYNYNLSSYGGSSHLISGTFRIGGIQAHGENAPADWVTVHFNESYDANYSAKLLQTALEGLGPYMKGVIVRPLNSREFEIEFDNSYWVDKDVPELRIENQAFSSGFMAGAVITTINEPIDITLKQSDQTVVGIPIYTPNARQWSDPEGDWKANAAWVEATQKTGDMIIAAFKQYWINNWEVYAPINSNVNVANEEISYNYVLEKFDAPEISVTVINPWTYEITFINSSGKINHPELLVTSATDAGGNEYIDQNSIHIYDHYRYNDGSKAVQTIKESSDAFRVNPAEVDDPWTPGPDTTKQYKPVITMDGDGDFVIAWETEANKSTLNRWNTHDINAQRFTLQGVLAENDSHLYRPDGKAIQSVRPVGSVIKVNDLDNGIQTDPTISCDRYGNFVVGWVTYAQDGSYFTGIYGRWFDRDGNVLTSDVAISHEWTSSQYMPTVAMSDDGHVVFAWSDIIAPASVYKSVFRPNSYVPVIDEETVATGYEPSIAFDSNNRYIITYTTPRGWSTNLAASPDLIEGRDIYMQMFTIYPPDPSGIGPVEYQSRPATRVNGTDIVGNGFVWHSQQYASSVGLDADGDIFVSYQGFAPDTDGAHGGAATAIPFSTAAPTVDGTGLFYQFFREGKNADLLDFIGYFYEDDYYYYYGGLYGIDPDAAIRDALIMAQRAGATQEQLGRLNAIYESVAKLTRGGSSDIGMTRFDSDYGIDGIWAYGYLVSDSIANNYRDGNNERIIIAIPDKPMNSGNLNLNVVRYEDGSGGGGFLQEGINIPLAVNSNAKRLIPGDTQRNIRNAINNAWVFAREYSNVNNAWVYATCDVQVYTSESIKYRDGTPWEFVENEYSEFYEDGWYYFEITLIGGAHDTDFYFSFNNDPGQISFDGESQPRRSSSVVNIYDELTGNPGTGQMGANTLVAKSGAYTTVWAQDSTPVYQINNGLGMNTSFYPYSSVVGIHGTGRDFLPANLFFRSFVESTDTAGPAVTDYYLPDGTHIKTGDQVTSALKSLVVVFDEEMRDISRDPQHGIENLKNWTLLKDGVEVKNGIESIVFGLNVSQPLAQDAFMESVNTGTLAQGTSKWEAVITFSETSVGKALSGGQYTLIAKNTLADIAGNVLNRNGLAEMRRGADVSIVFNVSIMDGYLGFDKGYVDDTNFNSEEHVVNGSSKADGTQNRVDGIDPQVGEQYFREDEDPKHYPVDVDKEPGGKTVASDAEGNFAVVWTSTDPGNEGIFLRKYRTKTVYGLNGKSEVEDTIDTIRLTDNPTAMHPTVAMDGDGDIVVCWSEENLVDGLPNRDVYFSYVQEANGKLVIPEGKGSLIANTEQEYAQQHPAVAMSNEGDFVITWESEFQDTSGWGIYGQRFAPDCSMLGGLNCVQDITITGAPSGGTFNLRYTLYDGDIPMIWETDAITIYQNTFEMEVGIQKALENMKGYKIVNGVNIPLPDRKLDVEVKVISMSRIIVEFVGPEYGNQEQPQLAVYNAKFKNAREGQSIKATTSVTGGSGEFQVNLSTRYDQRFPSIAMAPGGEFVISWTGWEPAAGTNTLYSDVYARKFVSSSSLRITGTQTNMQYATNTNDLPLIISNDDPANHEVQPGMGYDGVVLIRINSTMWGSGYGSGTLLASGLHILTAAHVVADPLFGNGLDPNEITVTFFTNSGPVEMGVSQVIVHPTYQGEATFYATSDIAVLQLKALAPANVQRYDIYRGRDELGKTVTKVGFGDYGFAGQPVQGDVDPDKRMGTNSYDLLGPTVDPMYNPELLMFDFDDGTAANDYFGNRYGVRNTGTGFANEVTTARGDSGGPGFVDGKIAGITSGGILLPIDDANYAVPNGFYAYDVRVSGYVDWIDAILSGGGQEFRVNQQTLGDQLWSDVAMDASGNFVVTWTQSLINPGSIELPPAYTVMARRFDNQSQPLNNFGDEFLVSSNTASYSKDLHQLMSKISMTPKGDFVITWEALADRTNQGDGLLDFDILARRYVNSRSLQTIGPNNVITDYGLVGNNGEMSAPFYVNKTTEKNQRAASVAVDSTGDMVFVWNGYTSRADKKYEQGEEIIDDYNILYRRITVPKDISAPYVTDVVAAVKNDEDKYDLTQVIEGITLDKGPNAMIVTLSEEMFSRNVVDSRSIINPDNWTLYKDGYILPESIVKIDWYRKVEDPFDPLIQGRSSAHNPGGIIDYDSGKIEIVLTFDGDLSQDGWQGLQNGKYNLVLSGNVEDIMEAGATSGNKLDGNYDGLTGGNFDRLFFVGDTSTRPIEDPDGDPTYPTDPVDPANPNNDPVAFNDMNFAKTKPVIAYRDDGSFVVVAVEARIAWDVEEEVYIDTGGLDIIARLYDKNGVPVGYERIVNNYTIGDQTDPDVSMDNFGNFVVVWSGPGERAGHFGIHARVFDAFGNPVAQSFQLSNSDTLQMTPKVALNNDGTFVVTWVGYNNGKDDASKADDPQGKYKDQQVVYARVFAFSGLPVANRPTLLAGIEKGNCYDLDIACDRNGNYAVTWSATNIASGANNMDIFAKTFRVDSNTGTFSTMVAPFRVNTYTVNEQSEPVIAMSGDNTGRGGDFVVAWKGPGSNPQSTTVTLTEVYARAFTATGASIPLLGSTSDVRINEYAIGYQLEPDVAFSQDGKTIAFTWASMDQELHNYDPYRGTMLHDYAVYARVLKGGVGGYNDPVGYKSGEFQVNRTQIGDQNMPAIAMDADGDYSIVWVGPYAGAYTPPTPAGIAPSNIYIRSYRPNGVSSNIGNGISNRSSSSLGVGTTLLSGAFGTGGLTAAITTNTSSGKMTGLNQAGATYIRPSGGGYANYDSSTSTTVSTVYTINGTAGNDILTVTPASTSGSWTVKLNGTVQNVPKGTTEIVFNGGAGKNEVQITGSAGQDDVLLNATTQLLVFTGNGLNLRANNVTDAVLDGAGGDDSINLTGSAGDDVVDISFGKLLFYGTGLNYTANNFERVSVLSGGGKDVAVLRDSKDEDYLEMSANYARMTGKGFSHEVTGFDSISAYSDYGRDTAVFAGSRFKDVLTAYEDSVILTAANDSYYNRAKGFQSVTINGIGEDNVATINGSRNGADRFTASETGAEMTYYDGYTLNFNGFQKATVNAGLGFSSALLTGGSRFVGYDDHCSYLTGNLSVTLNGFDSTVVHAQSGVVSQATLNVGGNVSASIRSLGRTTVLNENNADLYSLIAFDQIYAKKEAGSKVGKVEAVADHLFTTGDWEFAF